MLQEKKRVLIIISRFSIGGAEKIVLNYCRMLSADFEFKVISTAGGGDLEEEFKEAKINFLPGKNRGLLNIFKNWQMFKRIVRKYQPDLIHTHVFGPDVAGYLLKRKFKINWVSTQHNVESGSPWWKKWIWKCILKSADKVVAVSSGVYQFCHSEYNLKEPQLQLIRNGITLEDYLPIANNQLFKKTKIQLAIAARLESQKAHEILWQALALLKDLDWQLNVFGIGSRETELKQMAKKYGIEQRIVWHGVKRLVKELGNIDILIQPSWYEGLSVGLMEGMAAGRLVIASEAAGSELIKDKIDGFLFKTGNAEELTKLIRQASEEPVKMQELAEKASEKATKEFGIVENLQKLKVIYNSLDF